MRCQRARVRPAEPRQVRVRVFSADQRTCLGKGWITHRHMPITGGYSSPRIRLDTGRIVYGYECWWIDVKNAEAVRRSS